MAIFGKGLSEYLQFQKAVLLITLVVGLSRLGLSLLNVPNSQAKWLSLTAMGILAACIYAVRVHTQGFGSYRNLFVMVVIQNLLTQAIIIPAIVFGIFTGRDNIFTAPEFTVNPMTGQSGVDGKTWSHAGGHAMFGLVVGSLMLWALASLVLLITRKVTPRR